VRLHFNPAICILLISLGQFPRGIPHPTAATCTIDTRPVTFGEYDPFDPGPRDTQGAAIYVCTKSVPIRIEMSRGRAGSYNRAMFNGTEQLNYNLYLDATRQTVWGDGSGGTGYYSLNKAPDKKPITVPVYGRIYPMQEVDVGQYTDVIEVKILF
jgi:spore coat protein U-like protein